VNVDLQETERLVVEALEPVLAVAAGEARPGVALRVEPRGPAGSCASCVMSSTTVPAGASTVTNGKPTICSGSSNVAKAPSPAGRELPRAFPDGVAEVSSTISNEPGIRYSNQSGGRGASARARARDAAHREERLPHERHLARAQHGPAGSMPPSVR